MITVEFRIPSYGMWYFEELMKIESLECINLYPRLKKWPNIDGVEYRFMDEHYNDVTPKFKKK